jgi:hypothetical protein
LALSAVSEVGGVDSFETALFEMFLENMESCLAFLVLFSALHHHKSSRSITDLWGATWRFYDQTAEIVKNAIAVFACMDVGMSRVLQPNESLKRS